MKQTITTSINKNKYIITFIDDVTRKERKKKPGNLKLHTGNNSDENFKNDIFCYEGPMVNESDYDSEVSKFESNYHRKLLIMMNTMMKSNPTTLKIFFKNLENQDINNNNRNESIVKVNPNYNTKHCPNNNQQYFDLDDDNIEEFYNFITFNNKDWYKWKKAIVNRIRQLI
ncbi:hypothetical protein PIROE2DRAFT_14530 [Piromyces sp. E2]|nr:hypothetical protein PIROE2DRAFT_14530 [Piromyces sp. E2]|eukprot:OUM59828.1 hypothetical protein PIROE2DRAFT_14530 [Piromyces sp. E2]